MSILDKFFALRKTSDQKSVTVDRVAYIPRPLAGVRVDSDSLLTVPAAWRAVNYLAQTVAMLPWNAMRETDGGGIIVKDNRVHKLLHDRPNPEWSAFQFRETLMHWAVRWGNGYAEIERDQANRPYALWPIHPDRVIVERDPLTRALRYKVSNGTDGMSYINSEDMFHVRGFGEGPVGISIATYAAESIGWAKAVQLFGAAFFGNGMNIGSIIIPDGAMTPEGKREAERDLGRFSSVRNAFKVLIGDKGWKVESLSVNPDKGQFIETNKFLISEIARWFGVPPHKIGDMEHATFCLPASSRVFTSQGPKHISEVTKSDDVWSRATDGRWVKSRVEASSATGIDNILKIVTTNRTLRLNAKHRVLVRRSHNMPWVEGQIGGRNVDGKKFRVEWRTEYVPAGELSVGDTLVTLEHLPTGGETVAPNGRVLTPGFMAFCGLLIGDGNVYKNSVSIARAGHASYMDFYRRVIRSEFTSRVSRVSKLVANGMPHYESGDIAPVRLSEGERYTRFSSVSAANELKELGLSGVARTKRIPGWIFGLTEELRLAFIAGYLDADGSVDKKGRMSFHSVSHDLLEDARHLCISVGIPVTNARRAAVNTLLPTGDRFVGEISTFTCSDPGQNLRVPTATPHYVVSMKAGKPFGKKARNYPRFGGKGFDEEGCGLSRIARIENEPAEVVYDLTVATTHNFVADGIVVHNSNIEHQSIEAVQDSIMPWAIRFEQEADFKLFGNRPTFYTKINLRGLLRGDFKSQMEALQIMRNAAAVTADEMREFVDMNKMPDGLGGDKFVIQGQYMELKQVGEVAIPAAPEPQLGPSAATRARVKALGRSVNARVIEQVS